MGQSTSAPKATSDVSEFLNFPKEALDSLWTSYNLLGEGWGLSLGELTAIFNGAEFIETHYGFNDEQMQKLFKAFDTDQNGLVDALEMFVAISLTSGMDTIDKVNFSFSAYDFDSIGSLSFDEVTLLLRSVVKGLGKVSPSSLTFTTPTSAVIEKYARLVFEYNHKSPDSGEDRITLPEFRQYCSYHPVISSWLKTVALYPSPDQSNSTANAEFKCGDVMLKPHPAAGTGNDGWVRRAKRSAETAAVIREVDFAALVAAKTAAAEAAAALRLARPASADGDEEGGDDGGGEDQEKTPEQLAAETASAEAAAKAAAALPAWVHAVNLLQPEEKPEGIRGDAPEDVFEPVWLGGLNTSRVLPSSLREVPHPAEHADGLREDLPDDTGDSALMHRGVRYGPSAPPAAPVEGEEDGPLVPPPAPIIASAANHVLQLTKSAEEGGGWGQQLYTEHSGAAVCCLDLHSPSKLLVTGDALGRIVLWDAGSFAVRWMLTVEGGVKHLDISADGKLLLVVGLDASATASIFDLAAGSAGTAPPVVFTRALLQGYRALSDAVLDARFSGTSAMFATAFAKQELSFFIEEGGSFMGQGGLRRYEERLGLYQATGRAAVNVPTTELCRFEKEDEMVSGTAKGQVLLWHGRSCAQLLEAHNAPITALDFNRQALTLISGAADGTVRMYRLTSQTQARPGSPSKRARGPQLLQPRLLEISASFDILKHNLCSFGICSLSINDDCTRALVSTNGAEVVEVALVVTPFSPEEMAELEASAAEAAEAAAAAAAEAAAAAAAAAEDGEGGGGEVPAIEAEAVAPIPANKGNIGDDTQGSPILTAHFSAEPGQGAHVTGVCRMPAGGFASCATDGTVRWWQGAGGGEETGAAAYKTGNVLRMDSGCSVLDASATNLAVALDGTGDNAARKGSVHLFSVPEMQFVAEFAESKQLVADLKFSPEGNLLAVASTDGCIYVYQSAEGQWGLKGPLGAASDTEHAAKIDFSSDGQCLRSFYPATNKFRLWDVGGATFGKDLTDLTAAPPPPVVDPETGEETPAENSGPPLDMMRGLTWASNTCAYNWDSKGTAPVHLPLQPAAPGPAAAISAVSVSYSDADRFNHLLLSALSGGQVGVDRVPAPIFSPAAAHGGAGPTVTFPAHLGPVASLAFIEEGARLVTAGAEDGLLRVWRVLYDTDEYEPDPEPALPHTEGDGEGEAAEEGEEGEEGKPKLPVLYDSGEEDDLLDQRRMQEHLSRSFVKKRLSLLRDKALAARAATKERAARAAAAALAAEQAEAEGGAGAAPVDATGSEAGDESQSTVPINPFGPEVTQVDKYSGVKFWAGSLGLTAQNISSECTRALVAQPVTVPTDELCLDWVYGASTRQTRNAVHYTTDGHIVYPAGTMGIIYDKVRHSQVVAMPHADEVTCLDVHVASGLAASAHKGAGCIEACIWSVRDGSVLKVFDCGEVNGTAAVKLSPDASLLAVCCQDAEHTVKLFGVADGQLRASHRSGSKKPLCLAFSLAPVTAAAPARLLQGGVLHFKFLTFVPTRSELLGKTGGYGTDTKKSNVLSCAALPLQVSGEGEVSGNEFVLGMSDGTVGLVGKGETKVSGFTPVHKGAVTSLCVAKTKEGTAEEPPVYKIITGGVDAMIKVLDGELQPLAEFNLYLPDRGLQPLGRLRGFKSLCVDKLNRKILYGTAGGEVGEIDIEKGTEVNPGVGGPLVHSHFRDELHALCAHPLRQECITAGDDKTLRVWHLGNRRMATSIELPDIARCATFSPNGHLVVAGLGGTVEGEGRTPREHNGKVVMMSYLQGVLRIVHMTTEAKDAVTCVLFTPDGSKLVTASLDGNIYIYDALNNFQLVITLTGHAEGIASMDMSENGQFLTSTGQRREVVVWDLTTGQKIEAPEARFEALATVGLEWHVRQSPKGLSSVGVFPAYSDSTDTLTVSQSQDAKLLAAGDRFGALKLFRNPCCDFFAPFKQYAAHSPGGVSKVAFSMDDRYVLSVGRSDRILVQWTVSKSSEQPDRRTGHVSSALLGAQKLGCAGAAPVSDMEDLVRAVLAAQRLGGVGDATEGGGPAAALPVTKDADLDAIVSAVMAAKKLRISEEEEEEDEFEGVAASEVDFDDVAAAVMAVQKLGSAPTASLTGVAGSLDQLVSAVLAAQSLGPDRATTGQLGDLDDVASAVLAAQRLATAPAPVVRDLDDLGTAVLAASKPGVTASAALNDMSEVVSIIMSVQKLGEAPASSSDAAGGGLMDMDDLVAAVLAVQQLSADAEEDFAASFYVKGIDMAAGSRSAGARSFEDKDALRVQLHSVVGAGSDATSSPSVLSSATLPRALFFGQGDVLTCAGRVPLILEGGMAGVQRPIWTAPQIPARATSSASTNISHYDNPQQEQVSTFTVSNNGKFALVGHWNVRTGGGRLLVLRAPSGEVVCELSPLISGGVRAVAFSPDDRSCACIGGDAQHSLQLFRSTTGQWDDAHLVTSSQVSAANINMLAFIPRSAAATAAKAPSSSVKPAAPAVATLADKAQIEPAYEPGAEAASAAGEAKEHEEAAVAAAKPTSDSEFDFVTAGGTGHIKFWRVRGRNLECVCGDYHQDGGQHKPCFTALAACADGAVVTGDTEGMLHVWRAGRKVQRIEAHNYLVSALRAFPGGLISASSDKVVIWTIDAEAGSETPQLNVSKSISVPTVLSTSCGWSAALYLSDRLAAQNFVTSIDCDPLCQRLLLSFATSPVVSLAVDSLNSQKLVEGHGCARQKSTGASGKVLALAPHPSEPNTVATLAEDHTLRLWDVGAVTVQGTAKTADHVALISAMQLSHRPTAIAFLNESVLLVAVSGADNNGKSGAVLVVKVEKQRATLQGQEMRFSLTLTCKIHNVGTGDILSLRVAPKAQMVAACSADGCVYIYGVNFAALETELLSVTEAADAEGVSEEKSSSAASSSDAGSSRPFPAKGFLLAHPSGGAVAAVDFSSDGRYARTFGANRASSNGKVEVNFFDFELTAGGGDDATEAAAAPGRGRHAAGKVQDAVQLEAMRDGGVRWASVGSPAAAEVRAISYAASEGQGSSLKLRHVTSIAEHASGACICAAYKDGSAKIFRTPADVPGSYAANLKGKAAAELLLHSHGPALCAFTSSSDEAAAPSKLVTVSQTDGTMMVWKLTA